MNAAGFFGTVDGADVLGVRDVGGGEVEIGRIRRVERFGPELQAEPIGDAERLRQREIDVAEPGAGEDISAGIAVSEVGLDDEVGDVEPTVNGGVGSDAGADTVGAIRATGVGDAAGGADGVGEAAADAEDAADLPPAEETVPLENGQFVVRAEDVIVTNVGEGTAAVEVTIPGLEAGTAASIVQVFVDVVERFGPSVG